MYTIYHSQQHLTMALRSQVSLSSFKQELDDQLTCSICLEQYTNPKALPCLHSFCLKCIELLPVKPKVSEKSFIILME